MSLFRIVCLCVCAGLFVGPGSAAEPSNTGTPADPSTVGLHDLTPERALPDGLSLLFALSNIDDPLFRSQVGKLLGGPVDYYDTRNGTPSTALLSGYDCVFTWTNFAHANAAAFGDNLADAVDAGTTVILGPFSTFTQGNALDGRIMTSGYSPVFSPTGDNHISSSTWAGDGIIATHEAVGAYEAIFRDELSLLGSGIQDASYIDSEIAVAAQPNFKTSYMNGGSGANNTESGDWALVLSNLCRSGAFEVLVLGGTAANDYAPEAAGGLAANVTVTDPTNFNAMLGSRDWGLVLADVPGVAPSGGWADFVSYVNGGGPTVLSNWTWSSNPDFPAAFGYTSAVNMSWTDGISSLGPSAEQAGTRVFTGVPEVPHTSWFDNWVIDGAVFTPASGTTTVGLLDGSDPIILLNSPGNAIAAPLLDEWSGTGADELWRNLALEVLPDNQLDGAALLAEWRYPDDSSVLEAHEFTVGPGVDLPAIEIDNTELFDFFIHGPFIEIEFTASTIWTGTAFNGWRFTDLDSELPSIGRATIDLVGPGITGLDPDDLTYTEDSVSLNLAGVNVSEPSHIRIRVDFGIFFDGFEYGTTDAWSGVSP